MPPMNHRVIAARGAVCLLLFTLAPSRVPAAEATGNSRADHLDPTVVRAEPPVLEDGLATDDLHLFGAGSVAELSGLVPGLHVVSSDSRGFGDVISMRGVANTLFFGPPGVAMVVDDVPMGDVFSYPAGLIHPAAVRILRGPQGAQFGVNAPGGMIEIMSARPTATNQFAFETEYGSYDLWGANLSSSGPLGPKFAHTLQLYHSQRDGYLHNPTLGRSTDDRDLSGGVLNLYYQPDDDSEWRLRILAERADDGSQRLTSLASPDPFTVNSEIPGVTDLERQQVSLHGTFHRNWGTFKSITSFQHWKLDPSIVDLDLGPSPPGFESSSTIIQQQDLWTQELRWESPPDAGRWSWRSGLFFMDKTTEGDATRAFPVQLGPMFYVPFSERTLYDIDQWSTALYGRVGFAVDDRFDLTAGARLEYVDSSIDRTKTDSFLSTSAVRGDVSGWYFSPELGASYQVTDSTLLFARSAIGTKPDGYSAFASTPATARFDDEVNWTNELGVAFSLPEHGLDLTLTGFWSRIGDYQLNRPDVFSTDYFIVNAERVTSVGAEAELLWRPCDRFTLRGSFGYTDAEFDRYSDPVLAGVRYDGNEVPYIPEFTGSLGARYEIGNGFYVQTAVRATGETFFNEANQAQFRQGSYWAWDAEAGYANEDFSVAVYGRNLFDEEFYTFINPQIAAGTPGDPQRFGVRVRVAF